MKLFIDYHLQINDQTERANQNVKWYLWSYCSYMQDDWFVWLSMTEFVDNNAISLSIEQSMFFLNKNFHSHMSFNSDSTEYEITQARIKASKAENIFEHMKWSLTLIKQVLARIRVTMKKQIDKHQKKMIYKINDMMFLNFRNIMISRSSKKLDHKMLELFKILIKIEHVYWLKLSSTMKIHLKFTSNLLQLDLKNSLNEQWINWSSSQVFISTFWLDSSTRIESSDSTRVLESNLLTRLKYLSQISWLDLISISSRVRTRWLDSTRQAIEYDVKRTKYRNFSGFSPLHYLFALSFW